MATAKTGYNHNEPVAYIKAETGWLLQPAYFILKPIGENTMKLGLIYATMTGHSRKIARAVEETLGVEAVDIKTNPKLESIDLLFVVGGIYGGAATPELLEFLKHVNSAQVKKAVLLTSSGGKTAKQSDVRAVLTGNGIEVAEEEFTCQGGFLVVGIGHPNKTDLQNAVAFAQQWVA
jgi:flavodoxin